MINLTRELHWEVGPWRQCFEGRPRVVCATCKEDFSPHKTAVSAIRSTGCESLIFCYSCRNWANRVESLSRVLPLSGGTVTSFPPSRPPWRINSFQHTQAGRLIPETLHLQAPSTFWCFSATSSLNQFICTKSSSIDSRKKHFSSKFPTPFE